MTDRQWHYAINDVQYGPVSEGQLKQLLQDGALGPDTYIWTQGMEDWSSASGFPGLLASASGEQTQPYPSQPVQTTPVAVTVFGILNIVFGGMGLLTMPVALIFTFAMPQTRQSGAYVVWTVSAFLIGLVCTTLLIAFGIGLLKLRSWGRKGALAYGCFAVIWGIIGMIVNVGLVGSGAYGSRTNPEVQTVMLIFFGLLGLIYPICLIIFMRRPNVINACTR